MLKRQDELKQEIKDLALKYRTTLSLKVRERIDEMKADDLSHQLIYKVLGISEKEGDLIDLYQNKGRFLYKYAGSFLEDAAILCFQFKHPKAKKKIKIKNTLGTRPKTFEIDCLIKKTAFEIKWKDATTDGDHISKEHTRLKAIKKHGFTPVRVMFYYPNRGQAKRIQNTIRKLYNSVNGKFYSGEAAWDYREV